MRRRGSISPDVQRALNIVREASRTAPPTLRPTLNLELDLGLDSMQRVELLSQIEEQLGGNVEESQLAEIYTVRELIDAVLQSAASGAGGPGTRPAFAGWKAILAEEPAAADVASLAQPKPFSDAFWYLVSRLIQVIALDRFDLHVRGIEKLPQSGAYILSSNHQSYLDPVILASVLPPEVFHKVFAVGTSEIFGERIHAVAGAFPARRGRGSGRESDSRHARRSVRVAAGTPTHSLSRRRALD